MIINGTTSHCRKQSPNPWPPQKQVDRIRELTSQQEKKMDQNHSPPTTWSRSSPAAKLGTRKSSMKRKSISKDHDEREKKTIPKKKVTFTTEMIGDQGQSSNSSCAICFDSITDSDMFKSGACNHPFCVNCISTHVAVKIKINVAKVNCPIPGCCVELNPEILRPILSNEVIDRWETLRCESCIDSRQKSYCPFKNCSVLLVNDGEEFVTSSECPSCHRLFCAQCMVPWHGDMDCQEFQKLKTCEDEKYLDLKFFELAKREMWQKCPKCSIYVERSSGCEHIPCRCGCDFCYKCGKDWKHGHLCNTPQAT